MKLSLGIALAALALVVILLYGSVQRVPEGSAGVLERDGEISVMEPGLHARAPFSRPARVYPLSLPEISGEAEIVMTDGGPYGIRFTVSGDLDPERAGAFHSAVANRSVPDLMRFMAGQALARAALTLPSEALATGSFEPVAIEVAEYLLAPIGVKEVVLSVDFDSPRTLLALARALAPSGRTALLKPAIAETLVGSEAEEWEPNAAMGLVLESEGDLRGAEKRYLDALSIAPSALEPMAQLVRLYSAVGEEEKLIRLLGAAIQHDPASIQHLVWLSALQMRREDYEAALEAAARALALDPLDARLINNVGGIYLKQDNLAEAIITFRRALEVAPGDRQCLYNLGVALSASGDHREGLTHLLAAEEAGPAAPPLLEAIAFAYGQIGERERASEYRRRAREAAAAPSG